MTNRLIAGRAPRALLLAVGLSFASSSIASAHVTVQPKAAKTGGHERYVVRVPNEKTTATTRVEVRFPAGLRVTAFQDVPGWKLEILTDSAKHVSGAVWTGNLPPQRFVEFPFVAANPKEATKLVWPAFQTYADGEKVEWTGAEGTKTPASVTTISAGDVAPSAAGSAPTADAAATTGAANVASASGGDGMTRWVPWLALLIAVLSLALSLRKPAAR